MKNMRFYTYQNNNNINQNNNQNNGMFNNQQNNSNPNNENQNNQQNNQQNNSNLNNQNQRNNLNQENNLNQVDVLPDFRQLLTNRPAARATVRGSSAHPNIHGDVWFYQTNNGVLVIADIEGLPSGNQCSSKIFAFHIHDGSSCTGNAMDPFANAGVHYNPRRCPHPYHAGDLPPLFSANGFAFSSVLTDRFDVEEIIGKAIVIHSSVDDFTSQPAGNSGTKIACGEIQRIGF